MALRPLEPESTGLLFVSSPNGIASKALTANGVRRNKPSGAVLGWTTVHLPYSFLFDLTTQSLRL